jgi:hypothetical protein
MFNCNIVTQAVCQTCYIIKENYMQMTASQFEKKCAHHANKITTRTLCCLNSTGAISLEQFRSYITPSQIPRLHTKAQTIGYN